MTETKDETIGDAASLREALRARDKYTIVWCRQPNSNEPWAMECGVKGVYPTRKAAIDAIRKKFNKEIDDDVERNFVDLPGPGVTKDMLRGMTINEWMISKSRSSMSWMQYGEPYPVLYKVVKIPTEKRNETEIQ